jgi:hypothetical protein
MSYGWYPFKIYPKWPSLLKIEIWKQCFIFTYNKSCIFHMFRVLNFSSPLQNGQTVDEFMSYSNMTSFFRFVDKQANYRWYNLIRTCAGECDWLFHWQHKLCATFSGNVNINYRLPIKVYYHICTLTLRHIRIETNHGSQKLECVLSFNMGWRILVNFIRQFMLKLPTHSGFHDLFFKYIKHLHCICCKEMRFDL